MKKYIRQYYKTGKSLSSIKKWLADNKNKVLVHKKVAQAIKSGLLKKQSCKFCGSNKVDGHHSDYLKPLEVMWLCRLHHKEEHKKDKLLAIK